MVENIEESNSDHHSSAIITTQPAGRNLTRWSKNVYGTTASFIPLFLFTAAIFFTRWFYISAFAGTSMQMTFSMDDTSSPPYQRREEYRLTCSSSNMTLTCPANYRIRSTVNEPQTNQTCPDYFRWIHEDLRPWKMNGITKKMVESLESTAHFRVTIVNGTAYVKQYQKAFQTRDVFTLWGILQLLMLHPGQISDLDLIFQCHDLSSIKREEYHGWKEPMAPPQFHYCADESTLDIVFPDWSFWGWPEVNIKPWVPLMEDLEVGNGMKNWTERDSYAFWKGNLGTGARKRLAQCNSKDQWNAVIIHQDWRKEVKEGFKNSDLSKQCVHRYKLYMEGNAWSVSEKYILGCDSMTLLVQPRYYDFFTRSLVPMTHYWPVNPQNLCSSIKFAVDWGNHHPDQAQEIGKAGTKFIQEEVTMDHVYEYMFHLLNEYAKLLRYQPTVPPGSVELCSEQFACSPKGLETEFKLKTMVTGPAQKSPCTLSPPYDPDELQTRQDQNAKIINEVETWEENIKV